MGVARITWRKVGEQTREMRWGKEWRDFLMEELTLTMYKDGNVRLSVVIKCCPICKGSNNEDSDVKAVDSGSQGRCRSNDTRLMANREVVRVVAVESKVVGIRLDHLRLAHCKFNSEHWFIAVARISKIFHLIVFLSKMNCRFWCW